MRNLLPTIALVALLLLLIVTSLRRSVGVSLPRVPHTVILMVPGLAAADLRDTHRAPALVRLAERGVVGVTPAVERCPKRRRLPDDVCGPTYWPTGAAQGTVLLTPYHTDYSAADGYQTVPGTLSVRIINRTHGIVASPGVAVFDDLCRNDRYAPLALQRVTASEREYALRRLNQLIEVLMGPSGLPGDTALVVMAPFPSEEAAKRGERFCPVILWRRAGLSPGLFTSAATRYTPGLLTRNDVAATIAALAGTESPTPTGRVATVIPATNGIPILTRQLGAWTIQAQGGLFQDGLPVLLIPLAVLMIAVFASRRINSNALNGTFLGVSLLLIADLVLGGGLLMRTPLAQEVALGGRTFGFGGAATGLFIGSALFATQLIIHSRERCVLWAGCILITLIHPNLGADTGGGIAAILGFAVLGILNGPREEWRQRTVFLGIPALLLCVGLTGLYVFRNGIHGILATHTLAAFLLHKKWVALFVLEAILCAILWFRPSARLLHREYAALVAVFITSVALLITDDRGIFGATVCLLCAIPSLFAAHSYREEPEHKALEEETAGELSD